jgi:hypothetical protein
VRGTISGSWAQGSRHYIWHNVFDATLEAMLRCLDSNISEGALEYVNGNVSGCRGFIVLGGARPLQRSLLGAEPLVLNTRRSEVTGGRMSDGV